MNEATAYRNDIVPRAKGEAERIIQDANAYKERLTARGGRRSEALHLGAAKPISRAATSPRGGSISSGCRKS